MRQCSISHEVQDNKVCAGKGKTPTKKTFLVQKKIRKTMK